MNAKHTVSDEAKTLFTDHLFALGTDLSDAAVEALAESAWTHFMKVCEGEITTEDLSYDWGVMGTWEELGFLPSEKYCEDETEFSIGENYPLTKYGFDDKGSFTIPPLLLSEDTFVYYHKLMTNPKPAGGQERIDWHMIMDLLMIDLPHDNSHLTALSAYNRLSRHFIPISDQEVLEMMR